MELPLQGIIPPLVTPLLENGNLDIAGLKKLIEHVLDGGVHGLFLLGTTGEGTSLSHNLRKQMVTETCAILQKRVPLLVCITDTSFEESLELAHHAHQEGADVFVAATPYYLPISQTEVQDYLQLLLPELPLPFLLYNMPGCVKTKLAITTVKIAKDLGAIGIKDSSGDMAYTDSLLETFVNDKDFSIITGSELYLHETILKGGHGGVAGGANFFPKLYVDLYDACKAKKMDKLEILRKKIIQVDNTIYSVGQESSKYIKGIKGALLAMDICSDFTLPPITRFNEKDQAKIKEFIDTFSLDSEFSLTR